MLSSPRRPDTTIRIFSSPNTACGSCGEYPATVRSGGVSRTHRFLVSSSFPSVTTMNQKSSITKSPHLSHKALTSDTLFGIRYAHLIVIESAVYLYKQLLKEPLIERPEGDFYVVTPGVACPPKESGIRSP